MKYLFIAWLAFFIPLTSGAQTLLELNQKFIDLFQQGKYEEAVPFAERAVETAKKELSEDHPDYSTHLENLGLVYEKTSQYTKAEPVYIKLVEIKGRLAGKDHPDYATSLNNLADLYREMGLYTKAEPLYKQVKEIRKKILGENHPDYAAILNNLALLYTTMGQYTQAESLYIQAKDIWKKALGETHPDYATSLNNLAVLYQDMGQYEKAEPLLLEAKEIRKKVMDETHLDYAASLNNLGELYRYMGQYEKAEPYYIEARDIWKKALGANHPNYAVALNNLALLYSDMGQNEKAEFLFIQAKEIRKIAFGENHPLYAQSLNNLAGLYDAIGQYEKARPLYDQTIEILKKVLGENHQYYALGLHNLAVLYMKMGEYAKAEPLLLQAKNIRKKVLGEIHPDYAASLNIQALLYIKMGQYGKAEPVILQNSRIVLQNLVNNFSVLSEKEKGNYIANNISLLENNNSFIYNYKKASSVFLRNSFNLQLIFKSLTLADTRNVLTSIQQNPDSTVQRLFKDWQAGKIMLAKQYSLPIANREADLEQVEIRTESLEKELTRKSSEFRDQKASLQISMQDVQKNLEKSEVAIEFVRFHLYTNKWTDSIIYAAYILDKNDSVPVFVPLCEERQLQQLFASAGKTSATMVSHFYRGLDVKSNGSVSLGRDLYSLVWQPLEPYLKGVKKIAYSPAGKLYSIAFQALPVDSSTVLMDRYQLHQYTSTRQIALRTTGNQWTKPGSITLFGNASFTMDSLQLVKQRANQIGMKKNPTTIYTPQLRSNNNGVWIDLPGTAEEVKAIKQLFDRNKISTKLFVQAEASEENLKALTGNSSPILHLATHGFFLPEPGTTKSEREFNKGNTYTLADDPLLRSGLILAGGNYAWSGKTPVNGVEDGIATAYEISQLNLSNTELVVLSACETALGDVKGSEGVFGLQRAFKMAGVKKMIVSLWQVPDKETAELMTTFYTYWMKGRTIDDSFNQAQADMRKKYSPFYWAAFVLVE